MKFDTTIDSKIRFIFYRKNDEKGWRLINIRGKGGGGGVLWNRWATGTEHHSLMEMIYSEEVLNVVSIFYNVCGASKKNWNDKLNEIVHFSISHCDWTNYYLINGFVLLHFL